CQEVQVVIAEDRGDAIALAERPAQDLGRAGSAVDDVPDQQEPIPRRRVADLLEESVKRRRAALDVADRVGRHRFPADNPKRSRGATRSLVWRRARRAWSVGVAEDLKLVAYRRIEARRRCTRALACHLASGEKRDRLRAVVAVVALEALPDLLCDVLGEV